MKKTILVAMFATTLFACSTPSEKTATTATDATASSCVKEGPEVDLMKKVVASYSAGDWATMATCFSDTAKSWHNNDTVAMNMTDRIEMCKQQRATTGDVGHAWINFKSTSKTGETSKSLTFVSFGIKDGKILYEQVIYDAK